MYQKVLLSFCTINYCLAQSINSPPLDWIQTDGTGAYRFGYATGDEGRHYHISAATADNTVAGKFGYKDPATGGDLQTTYTAGRNGFRARGPHIARRMDLSQAKTPFSRPNDDGQYHPELDNVFDPNEDRGYDFSYRTPDHIKEEHANRVGDVQGRYSYLDDLGFRHNVEYIAGSKTGFLVTNPVPDTFAQAKGGPLYFVGKLGGSKVRGFSAVQKNANGAYRFSASGPDHKRSEISDPSGNRRGVYTYLDDKGIQHTVEYIAGPKIGYKVINNKKGVNYNPIFPYFPDSSTVQPLFPSSPNAQGNKPLVPLPTVPSSAIPPSGNDLFSSISSPNRPIGGSSFPSLPAADGSSFPSFPAAGGSSFPSLPAAGGSSFPSLPAAGGSSFPSLPATGGSGSSSSSLSPSVSGGTSKPPGNRPSTLGKPSSGKPPLFKPSSQFTPPPSLIEPSSSIPSFPFEQPEVFPSISPTFPSTSPFPIPARPQRPPNFGSPDQKWNYDFDYFFNDPSTSNKDWSKPIKGQPDTNVKGSASSTSKPPAFDSFHDFLPSPFPDPSFLIPASFDEGLNTAESGNGLKSPFNGEDKRDCNNVTNINTNIKGDRSNRKENNSRNDQRNHGNTFSGIGSKGTNEDAAKHYYNGHRALKYPSRGTVKFGAVKNEWHQTKNDEGYFAIPPGVAVRAHVQSLDIVPYDKRFVSPGEALLHHEEKKHTKN